jgi:hypothetical protein
MGKIMAGGNFSGRLKRQLMLHGKHGWQMILLKLGIIKVMRY